MQHQQYLLVLDTSGSQCQVVLSDGVGSCIASECILDAKINHSSMLLPMIKQLLASRDLSIQDISTLAYTAGPGSFTGVRIACSVAKGIAVGVGCGLLELCCLEVMAYSLVLQQDLPNNCWILVINDARKQQVYANWYRYQDGKVVATSEHQVLVAANLQLLPEILQSNDKIYVVGSGVELYSDDLNFLAAQLYPDLKIPAVSALARYAAHQFQQGEVCTAAKADLKYWRAAVD